MTEQDDLEERLIPKGWRRFFSYYTSFDPIWLWHAMFDGTWLCHCAHSQWYKEFPKR
jgi:hypothetical protein